MTRDEVIKEIERLESNQADNKRWASEPGRDPMNQMMDKMAIETTDKEISRLKAILRSM